MLDQRSIFKFFSNFQSFLLWSFFDVLPIYFGKVRNVKNVPLLFFVFRPMLSRQKSFPAFHCQEMPYQFSKLNLEKQREKGSVTIHFTFPFTHTLYYWNLFPLHSFVFKQIHGLQGPPYILACKERLFFTNMLLLQAK